MNLIYERWIPVRLADGSPDKIAPYEITRSINDKKRRVIAVASPRPDFDGALTQFLIGLLQTACTPETEEKWWDWRDSPPNESCLSSIFKACKKAFEFEGDDSRFLQELPPIELTELRKIESLIIGCPGKSTIDKNIDHFIKRDSIKKLCLHCSAAALLTLQLNASGGGSGYRTGIRGGGPLTTLVFGNTLWETCWLNVLCRSSYIKTNIIKNEDSDRFPWLAPSRTSEKDINTYPDDVHPDQQFWAMPCRIRFKPSENGQACDICGNSKLPTYSEYLTKKSGINYQGAFEHPLSPYNKSDAKGLLAVHPQPGGIGYRYWLGFVENIQDGAVERRPARVVEQFRNLCRNEDSRFWAFGFDFVPGQANARCWYDATMPIISIKHENSSLFKDYANNFVTSARYVNGLLLSSFFKATMLEPERKDGFKIIWGWSNSVLSRLKKSPSEKNEKIKNELNESANTIESRAERNIISLPHAICQQFWSETESGFFHSLYRLRDYLLSGAEIDDILLEWLKLLQKIAFHIFDTFSNDGDFDAVSPRSIALARKELLLNMNSNFLRQKIGLPKINYNVPHTIEGGENEWK